MLRVLAIGTSAATVLALAAAVRPPLALAEIGLTFSACPPGSTQIAPDSQQVNADGSAVVAYTIAGVRNEVRIAPYAFNPLTASDEDLDKYGIPPRPTTDSDRSAWTAQMESWHRNPDAGLCLGEARNITDLGSQNWAGYGLTGAAAGTYIAVQGDFTEPSKGTSCSGSAMSNWVGIGGVSSAEKLIQTGTGYHVGSSTPYAWYEYLSSTNLNPEVVISGLTISAGDKIHNYTVIQKSTGQTTFYVADNTTGVSKSIVVTLSVATYYDGTSAEWIDERPTVNKSLTPLVNFNTIYWTNARAENSSGTWLDYGSNSPKRFKMTRDGLLTSTILAYPSNPFDSRTFNDYYYTCS